MDKKKSTGHIPPQTSIAWSLPPFFIRSCKQGLYAKSPTYQPDHDGDDEKYILEPTADDVPYQSNKDCNYHRPAKRAKDK